MARASIRLDGVTAPVTSGRSIHERRKRASSSKRSRPTAGLPAGWGRRGFGRRELARDLAKSSGTAGNPRAGCHKRQDACQRRSGPGRSAQAVEELAHAGEKSVALRVGLLGGRAVELGEQLALTPGELLR